MGCGASKAEEEKREEEMEEEKKEKKEEKEEKKKDKSEGSGDEKSHKSDKKDDSDSDKSSSDEEKDDKKFRSGRWRGRYYNNDQKGDMDMRLLFRDKAIRGAGSDDVGKYQWSGETDGSHLKMVKQYEGAHAVEYEGDIEDGVVEGDWVLQGDDSVNGEFTMRKRAPPEYFSDEDSSSDEEKEDKKLRSGNWHGEFLQGEEPTPMKFRLKFKKGKVKGKGSDDIGKFKWAGFFEGSEVTLAKKYKGAHTVDYQGTYEDGKISGNWFVGEATGTFWLKKGKED
eukprot:GFYU01004750.1.p1 GENE.GFYU01004750.1~~GFYU01004750.1.p1  ORF type:complete len:282 (-),score=105.12 GFYU01004750.1:92-937(-)